MHGKDTVQRNVRDNTTIDKVNSGIWAIGRRVNGRYIALIEGCSVCSIEDLHCVMQVLGIAITSTNVDRYFPYNKYGKRCPTYELMKLWCELGGGGSVCYSPGV